ncbi:hypothetical protein EON83_20905, partial [bacterium]
MKTTLITGLLALSATGSLLAVSAHAQGDRRGGRGDGPSVQRGDNSSAQRGGGSWNNPRPNDGRPNT